MTVDENALIEYVTRQRWYGAKSRTVSHSEVLDTVTVAEKDVVAHADLVPVVENG